MFSQQSQEPWSRKSSRSGFFGGNMVGGGSASGMFKLSRNSMQNYRSTPIEFRKVENQIIEEEHNNLPAQVKRESIIHNNREGVITNQSQDQIQDSPNKSQQFHQLKQKKFELDQKVIKKSSSHMNRKIPYGDHFNIEEMVYQGGFLLKPKSKVSLGQSNSQSKQQSQIVKELKDQQKNYMQVQSLNCLIKEKIVTHKESRGKIKSLKNVEQEQENYLKSLNAKNRRLLLTQIPAPLTISPSKEQLRLDSRQSKLDSYDQSPLSYKIMSPVQKVLVKQKMHLRNPSNEIVGFNDGNNQILERTQEVETSLDRTTYRDMKNQMRTSKDSNQMKISENHDLEMRGSKVKPQQPPILGNLGNKKKKTMNFDLKNLSTFDKYLEKEDKQEEIQIPDTGKLTGNSFAQQIVQSEYLIQHRQLLNKRKIMKENRSQPRSFNNLSAW
ncbi:UNKNOWN [Stylonychia lemnae]|uniref:Uncharacterized protein n=1 Tax=Stylonychia lemnae TaxID=5949 RepID=A0A078A6W6_STYLE|nr:UNKNOWN [Stylonychia lemnae]|eukprot:CDW77984.1 UNKNOWN [Stylonychia lemnae]